VQSFNYDFLICCAKKRIPTANERSLNALLIAKPSYLFTSILVGIQTHSFHSFAVSPLSLEQWRNRREPAQKSEIHFFH